MASLTRQFYPRSKIYFDRPRLRVRPSPVPVQETSSRNFSEAVTSSWKSFATSARDFFKTPDLFTKTLSHIHLSPRFFIASAIFFVISLSIISLVFSTRGVTKGYVLRDLEAKRQILLRENEVKMMEIAQAQALSVVLASDHLDHMVPARKVFFMRGDTMMASR